MSDETLQSIWKSYQDAWADISLAERERLLRQSLTEDITFTDPGTQGQGFHNIMEHIGNFQQQFPGAYFKNNKLLSQHGQLLSEWTMFNKDGSEFLTAHSYAHFNEAGLLTHLAGFWQLP